MRTQRVESSARVSEDVGVKEKLGIKWQSDAACEFRITHHRLKDDAPWKVFLPPE